MSNFTRPTLSELALLYIHIRDAPPRRARLDMERLSRELMRNRGRNDGGVMRNELHHGLNQRRGQ
jgi:hypothetical protein